MEADKRRILKDVLGSHHKSGDEMIFKCPKCDHYKKKLSVNISKNVFKCWVCDFSGTSLSYLVKRYGSFTSREEWSSYDSKVNIEDFDEIFSPDTPRVPMHSLSLPLEFVSLANSNLCSLGERALKYLATRDIGLRQILKWRIGYCPSGEYSGRIIIPSFNSAGDINYYVARTFMDDWPKYKNPPTSRNIVFNELFLDWQEDLVIVEGVFDAIVADNAVPLLGSTLNERSKLFLEIIKNRPKVFFALDSDASSKQEKMIKKFLQYDITVSSIAIGGYEDVGSMPQKHFQECKKNATLIESDDYLLYQALTL